LSTHDESADSLRDRFFLTLYHYERDPHAYAGDRTFRRYWDDHAHGRVPLASAAGRRAEVAEIARGGGGGVFARLCPAADRRRQRLPPTD